MGYAIYCRVSTADQAEGLSLQTQAEACMVEIDRRGWTLGTVASDSASGKNMNRPNLRVVLQELDEGDFEGLVVSRLDRLTRSTQDLYAIMERAHKHKWSLVILDPAVDTSTPFGRAMAGMAAVFAQLERELIGQRQRESIAARRAAGTYKPPTPETSPEAEAHILTLHTRGYTLREIATRLNLQGVATPRGAPWSHRTVGRVLRRRGREIQARPLRRSDT